MVKKKSYLKFPAGTLETKSISVAKVVHTNYLCSEVLPVIRNKFRTFDLTLTGIGVQHDSTKTHFGEDEGTLLS